MRYRYPKINVVKGKYHLIDINMNRHWYMSIFTAYVSRLIIQK